MDWNVRDILNISRSLSLVDFFKHRDGFSERVWSSQSNWSMIRLMPSRHMLSLNDGMPPVLHLTCLISRTRTSNTSIRTRSVRCKYRLHISSLIVTLLVVFLQNLEHAYDALPSSHIFHLGNVYGFAITHNIEIRDRFFQLALKDPKSEAARTFAKEAAEWIVGHDGSNIVKGRMKYCRPIFWLVNSVDHELAVSKFQSAREHFHPIAQKMIERVNFSREPRCIVI